MPDNLKRPDPDDLLRSIHDEESSRKRGRLKIFFGMAAGVGKTCAMLESARRILLEGDDVVVGFVESHGRAETAAMARGFETIPRKGIDYGDVIVEEFDLDAALARKPSLILVDELAHSNARGSRHDKRYQDVMELLEAGMNVYTTLNVQHLESLADVVEKITGVKTRETLPDSAIDLADEIELVDIPPEELLKRLADGKVYSREKSGIAARNFFRQGNIAALREMALAYTTRLAGYKLRDYADKKHITGPWKSGERLMVAVSPSPYSEYLIRWTRRIAFNLNATWIALYIEKKQNLGDAARDMLKKNLGVARELGAEVISTSDDDIVGGLLRVAREKNITQIVVGKPLYRKLSDYYSGGNLVERLLKSSGDIEIHVVTQPDAGSKKRRGPLFSIEDFSAGSFRDYALGTGSVAAVTIVGLAVVNITGYWAIALLYLLGLVLLPLVVGRRQVILAAALSAALWNFLFIPPRFTFRIGKVEDIMMFGIYFMLALVMGGLTSRLRLKERALRKREERISELYEFSKVIGAASGIDEVVAVGMKYIDESFNVNSAFFMIENEGRLPDLPHKSSTLSLAEKERGIVEWSFKNRQPAGRYTRTLPNADVYCVPLIAPGMEVGVMVMRLLSRAPFTLDQDNFLQNILHQFSLRIEREILSEIRSRAKLATESERLYKILLSSVTHEIRTPLTAIKGSISTMMNLPAGASEESRTRLLGETLKASERMITLVDNLLDMNRIESGRLSLNMDWNEMADIIDVTLNRLDPIRGGRYVKVACPDDIPLVMVDYMLVAQALYCIIHNAFVHGGERISVSLSVERSADGIAVSVEDDGPGIAPEEIAKIFDKFYRGGSSKPGGLGLGLSISRGIAELHGGALTVENRIPHGARFTMALPVRIKEKSG